VAVGGMLGFDILRSLVMHIDYRDGLVNSILQPQVLLERPFSPP
jgi:hypothetical protein